MRDRGSLDGLVQILCSVPLLISIYPKIICAAESFPIDEIRKAEDPEPKPEKLTPEILNAIGEAAKLPKDSPHYQRFISAYKTGSFHNEEDTEIRPIFKHLRSNNGILLPTRDEVRPVIKLTEEHKKEAVKKYLAVMERTKKIHEKVPELPRCLENKTSRVSSGYKVNQPDSKEVLFDMLFIRKGDIPMDTTDLFGKRTIVRPYYTDTPNSPSLSALGAGVKCLPYRFRATKSFSFTDEGINALKNYDKNPHGAGVIHEKIKKISNMR